jgi:peptidoglycan L-alanyl-D-glutamate endopeptidase CwlK
MSWFSWLTQRNAIDPYVKEFKREMEDAGLRVRIGEVRRSLERQRALFAQGRTAPGPVVTWTLHSKHIRGRAFDFDFISALDAADEDAWDFAAETGERLGLVAGHWWSVQDSRHLELPD